MKKCALLMAVLITASISVPTEVQAIPAFAKAFDARVTKTSKSEDFKAAAAIAKCNICHFATVESKSKKQKNDFGKELAKHLSKKNYSGTRVREEKDAVSKEFDAAFTKAMAAKNPKGKTYQSRVDAGELPGSINDK